MHRTFVLDKIIRHTLRNIVVDCIYFDTQLGKIGLEKAIRHTPGNIVVDGI